MTDSFMTPREVADLFQVTPATVRNWFKAGHLTGTKIAGTLRIDRSSVDQLLEREVSA